MTEDSNIIDMLDEDGQVLKFEHLLTFEVEEQFYIAFTPIEKTGEFDVGEVLIMRIEEDENQGDLYMPIDSEQELDELWEIFQQLYYADEDEEEEQGDN